MLIRLELWELVLGIFQMFQHLININCKNNQGISYFMKNILTALQSCHLEKLNLYWDIKIMQVLACFSLWPMLKKKQIISQTNVEHSGKSNFSLPINYSSTFSYYLPKKPSALSTVNQAVMENPSPTCGNHLFTYTCLGVVTFDTQCCVKT